jgi:hypothetical protein
MSAAPTRMCAKCTYFLARGQFEGGNVFGECHRYAPKPVPDINDRSEYSLSWPSVSGKTWCGEYEYKPK